MRDAVHEMMHQCSLINNLTFYVVVYEMVEEFRVQFYEFYLHTTNVPIETNAKEIKLILSKIPSRITS